MVKKFGLDELKKFTDEVGFHNGDVRIIKGVLAIVGMPNAITEEAHTAIVALRAAASKLIIKEENVVAKEDEEKAVYKETMVSLAEIRDCSRKVNKDTLNDARSEEKAAYNSVRKLESILKRFS